ncbi:MAG: hypothetical protein K2Z81_13220, partial [Cyanobacteria bacterium]|nr:hypothetical protein [Cyanobacteriota bacterium]
LTAGVQRMVGDDEGYDEQVAELIAAMQKHIKEEEQQLFPALERCEIDFDALGKKLAESRDALISG